MNPRPGEAAEPPSKDSSVSPALSPAAIVTAKKELRRNAALRRADAAARLGGEAGERLRDHFLAARQTIGAPPSAAVSGYWPMGDEIDVRPLLTALAGLGHLCLLPVVAAPRNPLVFRLWVPGDTLDEGVFGTRQPQTSRLALSPRIVLAPLLAFDRAGHRLGYGGGFYDRTIAGLRSYEGVTVVGVAFAEQEVDTVPHEAHDQRLDWIVTERGVVKPE